MLDTICFVALWAPNPNGLGDSRLQVPGAQPPLRPEPSSGSEDLGFCVWRLLGYPELPKVLIEEYPKIIYGA